MLCPYCNEEMELGVIQSPHEINWGRKLRHFTSSNADPEAIVLGGYSFLKGCYTEAYLCRKCEKVIIDFSETE